MEEFVENQHNHCKNSFLSTFKVFIYTVSMQFLEKSYKLLPYKQKEELMLHLVNSDNLSLEETDKFLTFEERSKFKKDV